MPAHDARLRVALACAAITWPCAAMAQAPDLIDASAQYVPSTPLAEPLPAKAQVASYDVAINIPAPLGKNTFLIPGVAYHVDAVAFEDAPPELVQLRAFHALEVPVLFVQLLPHDWALSLRASVGLAGDFAAVDSDMIRVSGLAMATHSFGDSFVLGGGALASYSFGSFLPLPALYTEWKPIPSMSIEAFIPGFVHAKQSLWDRLEIGYRLDIAGNAYAVRDERIANAWPCADEPSAPGARAADPSRCFDNVAYSLVSVGPTLSLRLFASVWLNGHVGHTVFRRFEQKNGDGDAIPGGVQDLPRTFLVRSGLTWRIPEQDDEEPKPAAK